MAIKVEIDSHSGFCGGVIRAITKAEDYLSQGGRLYSLGAIVHNEAELNRLGSQGLVTVDSLDRVPEGGTVLIRAHGESQAVLDALMGRGVEVVNTTCPFVSRAQELAHSLSEEGYHVVLLGDRNHPEIRGIMGYVSGPLDVVADEATILTRFRELIGFLPANNESYAGEDCSDDLNRVNPEIAGCAGDTSVALSILADDNNFFEVKKNYAKQMVTGFLRLNGMTIGAVANRSEICDEDGKVAEKMDAVLTRQGCEKAADFVNFCDAFGIPVLTLTNVKGYEATMDSEKGIARAAAKLTYAFANATVPKVNVILDKAYGTAYVAMNSKTLGADITIAWPEAQIGTMDSKLAAKIMYDGQGADVIGEKAKEYAKLQDSALSAAKRGYVDYIIAPADTRKYVIGAFEMLYSKREDRPAKKHGTV